ncbi:MAG TPA: 16S rRNA (guanine(527)-N(7))-methyltransferase RsmG [Solirubrobacterales bacterium]|nr:16S rRNA (guanine(527)-N(7))-methyltransferase RsmG [Solirubrobacterales bacterium]
MSFEATLARLSSDDRARLGAVLDLLARDRGAPSAVRDPGDAWRLHVADSLSGPEAQPLASARRIADVGAGAGFPGLVLAIALPAASVDLIESVGRKCEFIRRAIAAAEVANARVIQQRAEDWARSEPPAGGREAYDVVTARAVGRLATLAELASPLLRDGGALVAWKGRRDPGEEAELERAGEVLAMAPGEVLAVGELAGSRHRHLHVVGKRGPTPERLPRRAGMAKKRPFGRS